MSHGSRMHCVAYRAHYVNGNGVRPAENVTFVTPRIQER